MSNGRAMVVTDTTRRVTLQAGTGRETNARVQLDLTNQKAEMKLDGQVEEFVQNGCRSLPVSDIRQLQPFPCLKEQGMHEVQIMLQESDRKSVDLTLPCSGSRKWEATRGKEGGLKLRCQGDGEEETIVVEPDGCTIRLEVTPSFPPSNDKIKQTIAARLSGRDVVCLYESFDVVSREAHDLG